MNLVETIAEAWGWKGLAPAEIVDTNAFGHVIVRADDGSYWRIIPEEPTCERLASNKADFSRIWAEPNFAREWAMEPFRSRAMDALGEPAEGRCFWLKIPSVLGGKYEIENLATISRREALSVSGYLAKEIEDLPDGAQIRLKIVD